VSGLNLRPSRLAECNDAAADKAVATVVRVPSFFPLKFMRQSFFFTYSTTLYTDVNPIPLNIFQNLCLDDHAPSPAHEQEKAPTHELVLLSGVFRDHENDHVPPKLCRHDMEYREPLLSLDSVR
jgi:hypothetical protein